MHSSASLRRAIVSALHRTRGAIDLASIMVGVLVVGLLGGIIAATVVAVVPWAQDEAARANLDAVRTAQSVARVQDGRYSDYAALTASRVQKSDSVGAVANAAGDCYVAAARSATGTTFYTTSDSKAVLDDKDGNLPDTTACANAGWALSDVVENLIDNPQLGTTAANWFTFVDTGAASTSRESFANPWGSHVLRMNWTAATTNVRGGFYSTQATGLLTTGSVYTASSWVHVSKSQLMRQAIEWKTGATQVGHVMGPAILVPANTWTRLNVTSASAPGANTITSTAYSITGTGGSVWAPGDLLRGTAAMLTAGPALRDYADGDTDGWTWDGQAGSSTSRGYDYTLEGIAGNPDAEITGDGTKTVRPKTPFSARTLYSAFRITSTDDMWAAWAMSGSYDLSQGCLRFQSSSSGATALGSRIDTIGGEVNGRPGADAPTSRAPGTSHVGVVQMMEGAASTRGSYDAAPPVTKAQAPGGGISAGDVRASTSTGSTPVKTYLFMAEHRPAQLVDVQRWMARHHGITIP